MRLKHLGLSNDQLHHLVNDLNSKSEFHWLRYAVQFPINVRSVKDSPLYPQVSKIIHILRPHFNAWLLNWLALYFTVVFQDGVETNNFNAYTGTTITHAGDLTVGLKAHHGCYGIHSSVVDIDGDNAFAYWNTAGGSTYFARGYFSFNALPDNAAGKRWNVFALYSTDQTTSPVVCLIVNIDNTAHLYQFGIRVEDGTESFYILQVPAILPWWYCIELKGVASTTVGEGRLYVDGIERTAITGKNLATTHIDILKVGAMSNQSAGVGVAGNVDIDCVIVSDSYNGIEQPKLHHILAGDPFKRTMRFERCFGDIK